MNAYVHINSALRCIISVQFEIDYDEFGEFSQEVLDEVESYGSGEEWTIPEEEIKKRSRSTAKS